MTTSPTLPIPIQESGPVGSAPFVIPQASSLPNLQSLNSLKPQKKIFMHTTNCIRMSFQKKSMEPFNKEIIIPNVAKVKMLIFPRASTTDDRSSQRQHIQGCITVELVGQSLEDHKQKKKVYSVTVRSIVRNEAQFKACSVTEYNYKLGKHQDRQFLKLGTTEEIDQLDTDNIDLECEVGFIEAIIQ